ncbi:MAG: flippase-like domain-containing protein [Gammaproteobacteria bacterium]|nr:flippase-like domain-containing protein [Gammaproteobacteria bacterium]
MKTLFKIVVSIALLATLAFVLDWGDVWQQLQLVKWWLLLPAALLHFGGLLIANGRWTLLLQHHREEYNYRSLLPLYLIGAFFNNMLPSSTGGDLVRVYYIYRHGHGSEVAVSPVATERFIGLVSICTMATVAVLLVPSTIPVIVALKTTLPLVLAGGFAVILLMGNRHFFSAVSRLLKRWHHVRAVNALERIFSAGHEYFRNPVLILTLLAMSLVIHTMVVGAFLCLGYAVNSGADFVDFMMTVPLVLAAASLPVSVGGLGVRETTAVALFTAIGISKGAAGVIALLFIPTLLLSTLPGLFLFLRMKDHGRLLKDVQRGDLADDTEKNPSRSP